MPALNVDGHPLSYAVTGGGEPTLVLVHGAGGSHATWTRQLEGLADHATVVALDLAGHGRSGGDGRRSMADYAQLVREAIVALGRGRVVLGGHSMGGGIAQTIALGWPEMLRGLVLVGTGARLRVLPRIFELLGQDPAAAAAFITGIAWSPSARAALREGGRRALLETRAAVTHGDFTACDAFDAMARVGEIALPTLVVVGEDDQLTPLRYAEYLAGHIRGARLARIPGAGHFVTLEAPDAVNAAIRAFLDDMR
jgi:pimeloyl-ACP methyl ester carboxylesterase